MKQSIFFFLALFIFFSSYEAQNTVKASSEDFKSIKDRTLIVIFLDNPDYNDEMYDAFTNNFTYTKVEFKPTEFYAQHFQDPKYYFFIPSRLGYDKGYERKEFNYFGILKGVNADFTLAEFAIPIAYLHVEDILTPSTYFFCFPDLVKNLNDLLVYASENNVKGNKGDHFSNLIGADILKWYNSKTRLVQGKRLFVLDRYLDEESKALFEESSFFRPEVVNEEAIKRAIELRDPKTAYLYLGQSPGKLYIFVIDGGTGEIIHLAEGVLPALDEGIHPNLLLDRSNAGKLLKSLDREM